MRGVQETRQPVRIVLLANALSAVASPVLVYGLHLGLNGSAIANVAAQAIGGGTVPAGAAPGRVRPAATVGRDPTPAGGRSGPRRTQRQFPGRLPDGGGGGVAAGDGRDRRPPDRPPAVGLHRSVAGLVRHRGPVTGGCRAGRRRRGRGPGYRLAGGPLRAWSPASASPPSWRPGGTSSRVSSPRRRRWCIRPTSSGPGSWPCSRRPASSSPSTGC